MQFFYKKPKRAGKYRKKRKTSCQDYTARVRQAPPLKNGGRATAVCVGLWFMGQEYHMMEEIIELKYLTIE